MSLIQIKNAMRRLSLDRLKKLDAWLHELIRRAEESERERRLTSRKQTVARQIIGDETYRQESIRCGKENCKCAQGKLHGPYWYSYSRVKDKVSSRYIGKSLPKDVETKLQSRTER